MADRIPAVSSYAARPGQSLDAHLGGVVDNIHAVTNADSTTAYGDEWETVMETLGWLHDAGKLTTFFQQYLETGTRAVADWPELTYHGFVSALLSTHALASRDVSRELCVAGFYAVAKHHGVIPNVPDAHSDYAGPGYRVNDRYDLVRTQLQDIDTHAADAADALLTTATNGNLRWDDIKIDAPEEYKRYLQNPERFDEQFYETLLRAWSTLVCADKLDAAGIPVTGTIARPDVQTLRKKVDALPTGNTELREELNQLRQTAHDECHQQLRERHEAGERLFRLTLPTGFGKTLTGLRSGLELAEATGGRVIYALPYTSILDQVDTVCQEFLGVDSLEEAYTVHHHLADTKTALPEAGDGMSVTDRSETLYAETWQSGLVLTTFTQLFESLAGPGNTQSMKLPALQDSVIILDEPQGIALDWWNLVGRLAAFVTREYDATVIMMTATQPQIFQHVPDLPSPTPLIATTADCVDFLHDNPRVEFSLHETVSQSLSGAIGATLSYQTAAETVLKATEGDTNTLAIVNTIESAGTLTDALLAASAPTEPTVPLGETLIEFQRSDHDEATESLPTRAEAYLEYTAEQLDGSEAGTLLITLTTRLRPIDRKLLLAALRQLLDSSHSTPFDEWSVVTVSTQLIEAGVDVSFDRLFRDMAPIPALVQAAGRCNREFGGTTRTVTVWRLAAPDTASPTPPSELIYGQRSLLRPAREALAALQDSHGDQLPEATLISTGIEEYYQALHKQRETADRADTLVSYFDTANGAALREASLIGDEYDTQDIVVLCTAADIDAYESYTTARDTDEYQRAQSSFDALKPLLVTVPVNVENHSDETPLEVADISTTPSQYDIVSGRGVDYDGIRFDQSQ